LVGDESEDHRRSQEWGGDTVIVAVGRGCIGKGRRPFERARKSYVPWAYDRRHYPREKNLEDAQHWDFSATPGYWQGVGAEDIFLIKPKVNKSGKFEKCLIKILEGNEEKRRHKGDIAKPGKNGGEEKARRATGGLRARIGGKSRLSGWWAGPGGKSKRGKK